MRFVRGRRSFLLRAAGIMAADYALLVSGYLLRTPGRSAVAAVDSEPLTADSTVIKVDSTLINISQDTASPPPAASGPLAVAGVTPDVLVAGSRVQVLIVGTGFQFGAQVRFCPKSGISVISANVVDANTIVADADVPAAAPEISCGVRIDNPDGEKVVASGVISISADAAPPPPPDDGALAVSAVTPDVLAPGSLVQVTISGSGFQSGAKVRFCPTSGISVTSVNEVNANTIVVEIDVPSAAPEGTCGVRIDNPDGEKVVARNTILLSNG